MSDLEEEDKNESKTLLYVYGVVSIILVVVVWYALWYYIDHYVKSCSPDLTDPQFQGLFGDKFGFVNSLFSALAFAGIIFTIILQGKELELQRIELRRTKKVFQDQHITMGIQRFESTFFNLMELINNTRSSIKYKPGNTLHQGHEAIDELMKLHNSQMTTHISNVQRKINTNLSGDLRHDLPVYKEIFKDMYAWDRGKMSTYLKIVFRVLEFIHLDQDLVPEEKQRYADILVSFFNENELKYIFYYISLIENEEKFNFLANQYFDSSTINMKYALFDEGIVVEMKILKDPYK